MLINLHPTRFLLYRLVAIFLILIMVFSKPVTSYAATDYYNEYGYWFRSVKVVSEKANIALSVSTGHELTSMQYYIESYEVTSDSFYNRFLGISYVNSDWIPFIVNFNSQQDNSNKSLVYKSVFFFYNIKDSRFISSSSSFPAGCSNVDSSKHVLTTFLGKTEMLSGDYNNKVGLDDNLRTCGFYTDDLANAPIGLYSLEDFSFTAVTSDLSKHSLVKTNIPMFETVSQALNYFKGDSSFAPINKNMLDSLNAVSYDSSVEIPQNFRITYNTLDEVVCYLEWDQSSPLSGRKTEVYVKINGYFYVQKWLGEQGDLANFSTVPLLWGVPLTEDTSGHFNDRTQCVDLARDKEHPSFLGSSITNLFKCYGYMSDTFEPYKSIKDKVGILHLSSLCCHFKSYEFYIRNVVGQSSSDWAVISLDLDSLKSTKITFGGVDLGGGTPTLKEGTTKVIAGNNTVEDVASGIAVPKDSYVVEAPSTSNGSGSSGGAGGSADLTSNIKSGFGLLGSGGLMAFYRELYDFIPPVEFAILTTGLSTCVLIAIWKFIRG